MDKYVKVSEEVFQKLSTIGGDLFDRGEVVARLLSHWEGKGGSPPGVREPRASPTTHARDRSIDESLSDREPRERGATVRLGGKRIHGSTVADLYQKCFSEMLSGDKGDALRRLIPYRTSNRRYLIAKEPTHPHGREFFVPIKVEGFYVETHKNYQTAITQLAEIAKKLGITFEYLD